MLYRLGSPYGTVAGQVTDLSEQALYYCMGNRRCDDGWWIDTGALTVASKGAYNEVCLPYSVSNFACSLGCNDLQNWVKNGTGTLQAVPLASWEAVKSHIVNYGPVSVGFNVYSDFPGFPDSAGSAFPSTYVWPGTKTWKLLGGHAVMCYGFDDNMPNGQTPTSTGTLFCRNSWNTRWGDQGHFKIAYGADGIMSSAADTYGFIWTPAQAPVSTSSADPVLPTTSAPAPIVATTRIVLPTTSKRIKTTKLPAKPRFKLSAGNCQRGLVVASCAPYRDTFLNITSVFYGRDVIGASASYTGGCRTPNARSFTSRVLCGGDKTARWRECNGYTTCSGTVDDATMGRTTCGNNVWKLARVHFDCLPIPPSSKLSRGSKHLKSSA
jgi:hypothetical protein